MSSYYFRACSENRSCGPTESSPVLQMENGTDEKTLNHDKNVCMIKGSWENEVLVQLLLHRYS